MTTTAVLHDIKPEALSGSHHDQIEVSSRKSIEDDVEKPSDERKIQLKSEQDNLGVWKTVWKFKKVLISWHRRGNITDSTGRVDMYHTLLGSSGRWISNQLERGDHRQPGIYPAHGPTPSIRWCVQP